MFFNRERLHFDLFELDEFFYHLKNKLVEFECPNAGEEKLRITITNWFIEQDKYYLVPGISCDYHETKDATKYCALSCVNRWYFLFANHICEPLGVPLIAGKHVPLNALPQPVESKDEDEEKKSSANSTEHESLGEEYDSEEDED